MDYKIDNLTRFDIIYETKWDPPVFPCIKCGKEECDGKNKCKGYGSYILGVKIGDP